MGKRRFPGDKRRLLLVPRISEAQFPVLRALMECEERFPKTYGEWTEFWARRQLEEEARGFRTWFIDLDGETLKQFLVSNRMQGSWRSLAWFIALKVQWTTE